MGVGSSVGEGLGVGVGVGSAVGVGVGSGVAVGVGVGVEDSVGAGDGVGVGVGVGDSVGAGDGVGVEVGRGVGEADLRLVFELVVFLVGSGILAAGTGLFKAGVLPKRFKEVVPRTEVLLEGAARDQMAKIPPAKDNSVIKTRNKVNIFADTGDSFSGSSIFDHYSTTFARMLSLDKLSLNKVSCNKFYV